MGMLQRYFARQEIILPEMKVSKAGPSIARMYIGQPQWTPRDYGVYIRESYLRNAIAFRCVKLIAGAAASVPWLLTKGVGKDKKEVKADHELYQLLDHPSPLTGGHQFMEAFYAYLMLAGNTYVEKIKAQGKTRELWNLRPDRMKVVPGKTGLPMGYEYEVNGQKTEWTVNQLNGEGPIIHMKDFGPLEDWYGQSSVEAAARSIDRFNAATAHNTALLQNGARPTGALIFENVTVDGRIVSAPDTVIADAEKMLDSRHNGADNAGRPMVLGGNVKWQEMAFNPRDMDFHNSKEDAARDICNAFGVPHILIVPGASTYNNVREAKLELFEDTILPMMDRCKDVFQFQLGEEYNVNMDFDYDEILALEPRRESKRTQATELYKSELITRDEARELLQYDPEPDFPKTKLNPQMVTAMQAAVKANVIPAAMLYQYLRSVGITNMNDEAIATALETQIEDALAAQIDAASAMADAFPDAGGGVDSAGNPKPGGTGGTDNPGGAPGGNNNAKKPATKRPPVKKPPAT